MKFAPVQAPDKVVPVLALDWITEDDWHMMETQDHCTVATCFEWVKESLGDIFKEELAVYRHHRRATSIDGLAHIMQYSLLQQLVRQDIKTYKIHVSLRTDGKREMMAFPTRARVWEKGQEVDLTFYEGNSLAILQGVVQHALKDEFVFSDECSEALELLVPVKDLVKTWLNGARKPSSFINLKGKAL
jgi:hypothetical protein